MSCSADREKNNLGVTGGPFFPNRNGELESASSSFLSYVRLLPFLVLTNEVTIGSSTKPSSAPAALRKVGAWKSLIFTLARRNSATPHAQDQQRSEHKQHKPADTSETAQTTRW